jgi:tungstate transport system permease protein
MDLLEPSRQAFSLLLSGDRELWAVIWLSLWVSVAALALLAPVCVPLGFVLARVAFRGRRSLVVLIQGFLSFPTVVVGLVLYLLLSRRGPLGAYELIGYMVIALPILVVFTVAAVQGADARIYETARGLGAGRFQAMRTTLWEVRFAVTAGFVNAFGRVVSEVGCALLVGGNIAGLTRNIPTAIALETSKGEFAYGIALGFVLMVIAVGVNVALAWLQGEGGLE